MPNFPIQFTHPWLLLLIIPLIGIALLLFFRVKKKYRRTRNRIISLVLHCIACVLCVSVLAGVYIQYEIPNETNEVILLVDVSDSEELSGDSAQNRDEFVLAALETGMWYEGFSMGVVTFAFDQVYAVPLTNDIGSIYERYQEAELPKETGGTDLAAALTYTSGLFSENGTGKIVLVTDGKETDESAITVIRSVVARGISVDTAYIGSSYEAAGDDVQVMGVEYPDYHLNTGDSFDLRYSVYSTNEASVSVTMYDNDEEVYSGTIETESGLRQFTVPYVFESDGLHEVRFEVGSANDLIEQNNIYYSYYYLQEFNHVLIVEQSEGESETLAALLRDQGGYEVDILNLHDPQAVIPTDPIDLCEYDQVIMNNIANSDMSPDFVDALYAYVNEYGGGMLTVGGKDSDGEAHAYNRGDMLGEKYQEMLPVEAVDYTPPIAVMLVIDSSGSMTEPFVEGGEQIKLDLAKVGAQACVGVLTERDYVGIITLDDSYEFILPLTSWTQGQTITRAINSITAGGGTRLSDSLNRANTALMERRDVARRHIIVVTDGAVASNDKEAYNAAVDNLVDNGITLSIVGVNMESDDIPEMEAVCQRAGGRMHNVNDPDMLAYEMRQDLTVPAIKDVIEYEDGFYPIVYDSNSVLYDGVEISDGKLTFTMGGFFGTRVRDNQYLVLVADYNVPLYAQWKFGAGTVGSFMCDLTGTEWSQSLMSSVDGRQFVLNMINAVMPVEDIEPPPFEFNINRGNYINDLSIFAELEEGQYVRGQIVSADGSIRLSLNSGEGATEDCYITTALSDANNYSRCTFIIKNGGVYNLLLEICDAEGNVISSYNSYLEFSYSGEYDLSLEQSRAELILFLQTLATNGNGEVVEDLLNPIGIFENFETSIELQYDPRLVLLISAIILFLLDVAVRKFKFKWIHEIIRERGREKENQKSNTRKTVKFSRHKNS
ncbi:MAG TPA: VWA domain-containing protein [Candidatus Borkfalkia avicola]|uniref:VWA domain-containing protein n=1 Tax=Candidatus Borkfalkia avicola TaxID=2838503 RepID=A0A9D2II71_9FIRM|nr:VWA domain-containing protein [Candidatus Borkfalkia avicola]